LQSQVLYGLVCSTLFKISIPKVIMGLGKIRLEPYGLLVLLYGLIFSAQVTVGKSKVVVGL
jgi:hypothetical protein